MQWTWEVRIPESDTPTLKRSVFVLPPDFVKGKRARVVVLNDCAQSILEELRGQHRLAAALAALATALEIPDIQHENRKGVGNGRSVTPGLNRSRGR